MNATDGLWLVVLGAMLLAGYVAHIAAPRFAIPKVTLLLVLGVVLGPSALDVIPERVSDWFPFVAQLALAMVGFLLGESFAGKHLRETGATAMAISVAKSVGAAVLVAVALIAVGAPLPVALLLAGVAPATAPAEVYETVRDLRADGPLSRTTLEVVAIDDAWGIVLFALLLAATAGVEGDGAVAQHLLDGVWHLGGAVVIGAIIALPMNWITARVRGGEPTLVEAAGFVFLCAGAAEMAGASYLLACMTLGAVLANRSPEHLRPFHAIERVREPFLAIFFLLAGFELDLGALETLGLVAGIYAASRVAAFVSAAWATSRAVHAPVPVCRSVGLCLFPQAGVALGLALVAEEQIESARGKILPTIVATTVLFGIVGPILLRWRLHAEGEVGAAANGASDTDDAED